MPINPVHFAHSVCDEFLRYTLPRLRAIRPGIGRASQEAAGAPVVARHPAGAGAVRGRNPIDPDSVRRYLENKFGDDLKAV